MVAHLVPGEEAVSGGPGFADVCVSLWGVAACIPPGPTGDRKEAPRRLRGREGLFYGNFFVCQKLITKGSMKSRIKTNSCDCDLNFNLGVLPSQLVTAPMTSTLKTIKPSPTVSHSGRGEAHTTPPHSEVCAFLRSIKI